MSRHKRRKTEHDVSALQNAVPEVAAHIDTEINMRTRLAQTLQARIEWAMAMKTVLERGGKGLRTTPENFQQLASETLINAERPAQALFADPYASIHALPSSSPAAPLQPPPHRRNLPRDKAPILKGKPTFLYVHAHAIGRPEPETSPYLLLRCPVCSRTAFSSLQGLLNHARISHSIEWGTHDACIKACAVEEPDLNVESGSEVGVGPSGIRPGLQTIFERAVGVGEEFQLASSCAPSGSLAGQKVPAGNTSHDLGLHEETPALAPFLGKEVHRREIRVYDEDVDVDDIPNSKSRPGWKMSFASRHQPLSDLVANATEDIIRNVEEDAQAPAMVVPKPSATSALVSSSKSRFHFAARLTISDRSLFVGKVTTPEGTFSRKWMIAVDSPSYAIPINSVLKYVKVTPISGLDGPVSYYLPVPVVRESPYVVLGMTNEPFLARVELVFNDIKEDDGGGDSSARHEPQTVIVEHWIDLDPLKSMAVMAGEEQLLDAELDLRTEVKPAVANKISLESRRIWNDPERLPLEAQNVDDDSPDKLPKEYRLLSETAKRFPLVLQERDRSQPEVNAPYRLVSSRAQLNSLVLGRQQAIKWGRARAIRDSYSDALREANLPVPDLSVADVYVWLGDLREESEKLQRSHTTSGKQAAKDSVAAKESWCTQCGFEEKVHQHSRQLRAQANGDAVAEQKHASSESSASCILLDGLELQPHAVATSGRRSFVNKNSTVSKPLAHRSNRAERQEKPYRWLVQSVDPKMLSFVEKVVESAHIPAFPSSSTSDCRDPRFPLDSYGSNRDQVEARLAPLAILTQGVHRFLEELVTKGVNLATLEKAAILRSLASRRGGRRPGFLRSDKTTHTLLTPRHISEGVKADLGSGSGSVSTDG